MTVKELIEALQTLPPNLFVDITEVIEFYDKNPHEYGWYDRGEDPPKCLHRITDTPGRESWFVFQLIRSNYDS